MTLCASWNSLNLKILNSALESVSRDRDEVATNTFDFQVETRSRR